ncbi:MAG TPA: hypothetical protein VD995_03755 [Azospirillum sp.]|nr:hypothetical protein [Azospirillum sp.]
MRDEPDNALRDRINDLVTRLPATLVYSLLSEIEGMDEEPADRVRLVRQYVIEYLNRQRTNRARRLFTTLFEAFLVDDDVLFHAGAPVPGLVQRIDTGAVWEVLARDAFPLLAVEAQEALDQAAQGEIIDRAIRTPEALALRERMRVSAVRYLNGVLGNRKALDGLLTALSRHRPRRTKLLSANLDKAPPVAAETIRLLRDILAHGDGAVDRIADRLAAIPAACASERERERQADALLDATAALREGAGSGDAVAALLPLSVLHVKRNYGVVALYIRQNGIDDPVAAALTAHFTATCRALAAVLTGVLKLNERVPGSPIRPSAKDKARIEGLVTRIVDLLEALIASGLMEDRRTAPTYRLAWEAAAKLIATRVTAIAMERATVAASARRNASVDHGDVAWLIRFLSGWHTTARDFDLETFELHSWRETLLEELRANLDKAMKFGDGDPLDERMEHLLRINTLCKVLGQRISAWIPPSSHNMTRLVAHRLENGAAVTADERELIDDVVAAARAEVGKSRYWKSDELMGLIELSEKATGR